MVKKLYSKSRPETEIQKIRRLFPNYDKTKLKAEYSVDGKIIKIETDNVALQNILKLEGFTET